MAASQARYLALVARKTNCEYEGQQINQARTALSNQSANLFNQMLGLQVPIPPSTQDFTRVQYSYTDGINSSTISSWQQLSESDPDYNYIVTHYYYTDRYTGSMKKLTDPQVQFSGGTEVNGKDIKEALDLIDTSYKNYLTAKENRANAEAKKADIGEYATLFENITSASYDSENKEYTVKNSDNEEIEFTAYEELSDELKTELEKSIKSLISQGALTGSFDDYKDKLYASGNTGEFSFAFKEDLDSLNGASSTGTATELSYFNSKTVAEKVATLNNSVTDALEKETNALIAYNNANSAYEKLNIPTYLGNAELTALSTLTKEQLTEINQVISDLTEQGVETELKNCFDANGVYTGGIFSFKMNGTTYYTTLKDLKESYASGTGNNHIDGQIKLNYYNAIYVSTKVEEVEKALLETDGFGRFSSVRFENDTVTYSLNMETVTDDVAYEDAMNQYIYENAKYDKMVQDINAQTSIIQQQDRQLELRLKQLDTEQKALSTEIDAVKKVVDDNVEKSFKTFGG